MGQINAAGLMDPGLYDQIAAKARAEHRVFGIGLFNWGEPMLHPRLPEFVAITKRYGLDCHLSSNLNVLRNIDEVLAANPDHFRISLSGFTQESYGTTHAHGDIEKVKENMTRLSEAKKRVRRNRTRITVYYHKYRDNLREAAPMRDFAKALGFEWMENWAYYMPYEKVLQLVQGDLPSSEQAFVDSKFALPIRQAVELAKQTERDKPCPLLKGQLTVDHRGNLVLCCAVYDLTKNRLGSFVTMSEQEMSDAMQRHPTCDTCFHHGLHRYFSYHDSVALAASYDDLARQNLQSTLVDIEL